ncbi:MAG: hypothetical protein M3270_09155 [Thermoproteota archaeon]|nr:hypothetical protein [Thermoproteota archaeon]
MYKINPHNKIRQPSFHLQIRLNFQLHPTEPANYTGSYTRVRKIIVDTEIAVHRSSRTILITAKQILSLLVTVSEEHEEGGLRI